MDEKREAEHELAEMDRDAEDERREQEAELEAAIQRGRELAERYNW